MRILIFGATGPSGIEVIRKALAAFHCTIILYVRSPEKLPKDISSNNVIVVIKGELNDVASISKAMEGVDAVLSALGPSTSLSKGPFHPSDKPLAQAYARIIDSMLEHNVQRLISLGTASITAPEDQYSFKFSVLVNGVAAVAHNAYRDMVAIGETIRSKGENLEWTIARVPLLTNNEAHEVRAGFIGDGRTSTYLSRADFAAFVIEELQTPKWVRSAPMLCSV